MLFLAIHLFRKRCFFLRKISKKLVVMLIMAVMLVCSAVPAFAAGSTYSWLQATKPTLEGPCGTIKVTDYSDTEKTLIFQGVATSSEAGEFYVKLQKQGFLGIWSDTNNVYKVKQHHNQTYDTVNNRYVTGQFFRLYWNLHENGTYRVVLYGATKPQVCGISEALFYVQ